MGISIQGGTDKNYPHPLVVTLECDAASDMWASALQVIEMHFSGIMNEYLTSKAADGQYRDPFKDPRKRNLTTSIAGKIRDEIIQANNSIPIGREVVGFWEDMKKRFVLRDGGSETENFFTGRIEDQRALCAQQITDLERDVRVRERALQILDGYEFKFDRPHPTLGDILHDYNPQDYYDGKPTPYTSSLP